MSKVQIPENTAVRLREGGEEYRDLLKVLGVKNENAAERNEVDVWLKENGLAVCGKCDLISTDSEVQEYYGETVCDLCMEDECECDF